MKSTAKRLWASVAPLLAAPPAGRRGLAPIVAVLLVGAALGCSRRPEPGIDPGSPAAATTADSADDPQHSEPRTWVSLYAPDRAWNGYTLDLFRRRAPTLIDMNGHVVHSWPRARTKSRVRLLEDGSLLGIALGRAVVEYDWDGNLRWEYRVAGGFPHHDVVRLRNGNTMLVIRPDDSRADELLEVDRAGQIVWRWPAAERLQSFIAARPPRRDDLTHINSVQEIPDNPWFRRGDTRFRPGNLLISARNLDAVFLIDRLTQDVVWSFDETLDMQHEALMIEPGFVGQGRILVFNNRSASFYGNRRSVILEVDPLSGTTAWSYGADGFFTPIGGVEQPLPNGNVLVTSTRGGRVFEVTRDGQTVWEWIPPFEPTRARRYPYDYCPQLARLKRPRQVAVRPPAGYRHIDPEAYRFARRGSRREVEVEGRKRTVLEHNNDCRELLLPAGATLAVEYGVARDRLQPGASEATAVRFILQLRTGDSSPAVPLLDQTLDASTPSWRTQSLSLARYAYQRVELCLATEAIGAAPGVATEELAFWVQPDIRPESRFAATPTEQAADDLTEEERAVRLKHLRALGYVD